MPPDLDNALDRVTLAILSPGQSTLSERAALRTELDRLVGLMLETAVSRAQEKARKDQP